MYSGSILKNAVSERKRSAMQRSIPFDGSNMSRYAGMPPTIEYMRRHSERSNPFRNGTASRYVRGAMSICDVRLPYRGLS